MTTTSINTNTQLLIDGAFGVYIPQMLAENRVWVERFRLDPFDIAPLLVGPSHDWYWEAWETVLFKAHDADGFTLYQDGGDLFAVNIEAMGEDEFAQFFGFTLGE